ncbi:membrane protein insertion efficiency factor YidD [Xinfangfangia sp. D13-10-4-6]|uniref:membrane protein insertion efficiency factor YidD n=1 Tax=Pseudogemmobacter hezensis TaxID=2737662 RepID=UPI00155176F8|nr:membrane protein insertion efficiency factor YidD [Pseudogemmobacter hezensis]NPD17681.1 membrane protein insertion efficiency factor YidD [Pseudogemmobacter hezensis]
MNPFAFVLSLPIRAYRLVLSPWVGHGCRFQPTCSAYAMEALERHGGIRGTAMTCWRICRCNPWGGQGYDPVPGSDPEHDEMLKSGNPAADNHLKGGPK